MNSGSAGCHGAAAAAATCLEAARELGPTLAAAAEEIERRRELPAAIVDALVERGLFRLLLPRSLGGAELAPASYVPVIEEIARHDASVAWCLGQACGCTMTAALLEPEAAHEVFGGARDIVAWGPPNAAATARAVPGGYRLTGSWSFASGSHHATWLGAHLVVAAADGMPQTPAAMRTFLFPKASATFTDTWQVLGLRGTGSDSYTVRDLSVPEAYTVRRDGAARRHETGRLYAFSSSNLYAVGFAGVALGIAGGTMGAFIDLARDKIPRGAKQTLRNNNVVQAQIAQLQARLGSARAFLVDALNEIWREVGGLGHLTAGNRTTIRLASTWAIHQAKHVVDTLYHAAGATTIFEANPFERRFRDIHTVIQQYQGRQAHFESAGRVLLGLAPESAMFTF
jgi:indole-3-acetate monooxygenase